MRIGWLCVCAVLWSSAAQAELHFPKPPAAPVPVPRDIECVVRITTSLKVVGVLYASKNGTEYIALQFDRNGDQHPDLVLLYPRVGPVQYRPFPTIYFVDTNLDGVLDLEYRDKVGDGFCQHFDFTPLTKGALQ